MVMAFFYLERKIFAEIVRAVRPGGLLIYKTYTSVQSKLPGGPKNSDHLLKANELLQLAHGLTVLHYQEETADRATAELVAKRSSS